MIEAWANESAQHMHNGTALAEVAGKWLPFEVYCAVSGGTNCAQIGMIQCTCYCVDREEGVSEYLTCQRMLAVKYAKAAFEILMMAVDIGMAVMGNPMGGLARRAAMKVGVGAAKVAAKGGMKAAAKAGVTAAKQLTKSYFNGIKRNILRQGTKAVPRLARGTALELTIDVGPKVANSVANYYTKMAILKRYVKSGILTQIMDKATQMGCEAALNSIGEEQVEVPDWIQTDYGSKWGTVETFDITGVSALIGVFHEADCPVPIPGYDGDSCAR